jgi:Cu/Ag efflux protein CusF
MKRKPVALIILVLAALCGCGEGPANSTSKPVSPPAANAISAPSPSATRDGDYPGKGVVTKINNDLGSVEVDHEEIPGLMPAMRMEFFVSDKKLLDGLKVGDSVDFVLRYKDRNETIVSLSKAK